MIQSKKTNRQDDCEPKYRANSNFLKFPTCTTRTTLTELEFTAPNLSTFRTRWWALRNSMDSTIIFWLIGDVKLGSLMRLRTTVFCVPPNKSLIVSLTGWTVFVSRCGAVSSSEVWINFKKTTVWKCQSTSRVFEINIPSQQPTKPWATY